MKYVAIIALLLSGCAAKTIDYDDPSNIEAGWLGAKCTLTYQECLSTCRKVYPWGEQVFACEEGIQDRDDYNLLK